MTGRLTRACAVLAGISLAVMAAIAWWSPQAAIRGYLCGWLMWLGVPLGAMGVVMIHELTGGRWGRAAEPWLTAVWRLMPLLCLIALPLVWTVSDLYPWARPQGAGDHIMAHKAAYLNVPFFMARAAGFLTVWLAGALWLAHRRRSAQVPPHAGWAAAGLIIYVLTMTFAAIDWIASLQPHWYSSVLGLYIIAGQMLHAWAAVIVLRLLVGGAPPPAVLIDLGNLLLVGVIMHAYLAYSQFFIIWNGNLPDELRWYVPRTGGAWGAMAVGLIIMHLAVPMAALLWRGVKRSPRGLACIAAVVMAAGAGEMVWIVLPSFGEMNVSTLAAAGAMMVGTGAVCAWVILSFVPGECRETVA